MAGGEPERELFCGLGARGRRGASDSNLSPPRLLFAAVVSSASVSGTMAMPAPDALAELLQKVLLGQERAEKRAEEQAAALKEQAAAQKERDEKQASLLAALTAPRGLATPATPAHLGHQSMETLELLGNVRVLEPGEGPPILTARQQAELAALAAEGGGAEAAIVRYMAPHLRELRQLGAGEAADAADPAPLAMVNSEAYVWLVHPAVQGVASQRLKPDLFLTWAPFADVREEGQGFPRGVLASPALQKAGCVAELYEAKSKALGSEAFGKQCLYHQCIPGQFKSALFNQEQCWLLETMHSHPVRLLKMHWTTPGSVRELQRFMGAPAAPPLLQLLRRVLARQQLAALSPAGRCHLGSGASGHVFAVHRTSDATRTPLALKLVLDVREGDLHAEFARMEAAAAAGAPVVAPVPGSLCIFSGSAAAAAAASAEAPAPACASGGYLLGRVGARFAATTEGAIKVAFSALAALHACRIYHGDARTANLLVIDGQAMWIDLRTGIVDAGGAVALPLEQQGFDAAVLARSMLPLHPQPLPSPVQEALKLYNAAAPGTVAALAQAVWGAL